MFLSSDLLGLLALYRMSTSERESLLRRRRTKNPTHAREGSRVSIPSDAKALYYKHLVMEYDRSLCPTAGSLLFSLIFWILFLLAAVAGGFAFSFILCTYFDRPNQSKVGGYCEDLPQLIYKVLPTPKDDLRVGMRQNYEIREAAKIAMESGDFYNTQRFEYVLNNEYMRERSSMVDVSITALVYSKEFSGRIGEVGIPLNNYLAHSFMGGNCARSTNGHFPIIRNLS